MRFKKLKNGFQIAELGMGTWPMGGYRTRDIDNNDEEDIQAIRYAIENGITCFDSAEMYAGWYAETLLGRAMEPYERSQLFISSKVRWDNCSYEAIKNACKNSLKRMKTTYIDLYYIHWRDTQFSLAQSMKAMNELVLEWKIRWIGVSNFSVESLKEAQSYSKYPIVANQVHYNLIFREPESSGLLTYCQENDIILVAWRPLELWKLAHSGSTKLLEMVSKYKKKHSQIAINWLLSQKNVVTLFKSSEIKHIKENLASIGWSMDRKDIQFLASQFPWQIYISDSVPLG